MQRLVEIPKAQSINGMFYGGAGTGKTEILGTAGDRSLYCNLENRLATIQDSEYQKRHPFNPIVITQSEDFLPEDGAKALVGLTKEINEAFDKYEKDFDFVLIDGSTALRRFAMNMGLEINQKTGKSHSLANRKNISPEFPFVNIEINDYTSEMNAVEKFILKMKELCVYTNKHFFMTAHERIEYNKPAKIGDALTVRSVKPGFTGQTFPDTIPGMFEIVWHTETKGAGERMSYWGRTIGDSSMQAKTCYSGFSLMEENPNIQKIIKIAQR